MCSVMVLLVLCQIGWNTCCCVTGGEGLLLTLCQYVFVNFTIIIVNFMIFMIGFHEMT